MDEDATTKLRAEMTAARSEVKLFDFGFENVDELKARCMAETGLEAPAQPEFQKWLKGNQGSVQMKQAS